MLCNNLYNDCEDRGAHNNCISPTPCMRKESDKLSLSTFKEYSPFEECVMFLYVVYYMKDYNSLPYDTYSERNKLKNVAVKKFYDDPIFHHIVNYSIQLFYDYFKMKINEEAR